MNCSQVDELLEEFSLGALSLEEEGAIRSHITDCRKHDQALTELQEVAERLPLTAPEREPPADLRASLIDRFEHEVASNDDATPVRIGKPLFLRSAFWPVAVAALLLVAIGLGVWSLALSIDGDGNDVRVEFTGEVGQGDLIYFEEEQISVLDLRLPTLENDRIYQIWGLFNDRVDSLGFAVGEELIALRHDLSDANGVAITVEPAGGSDQPTTEPFLVASLG